MIHKIRFDEPTHTYWDDKRRVPGYSEICASLQVGVLDCEECRLRVRHEHNSSFWTDDGREQGKALHYWLQFLASGKTTTTKPEPEIAGRVEAIKKFLRESKFQYDGGETPLHEPHLDYACTPDLFGRMGRRRILIDAKRGAKLKIHALQTAAQKIALAANRYYVDDRYSLYLSNCGNYRLVPHTDRNDEKRWGRIVTAFHDKWFYK